MKGRFAMKNSAARESALKEWWRDFFKPIVGEMLAAWKGEQSEIRVQNRDNMGYVVGRSIQPRL
jgi:hypothetical protein